MVASLAVMVGWADCGRVQLAELVDDRPGHDLRYAINAEKIHVKLDWTAAETIKTGLIKTVRWYLDNESWCQAVLSGKYRLERLGL